MSESGGLFAAKESVEEIGRLLQARLQPGDERIELTASMLAGTNMQQIRAFTPAGRFESPEGRFNDARGSYEISSALKRLRDVSYRRGSGTWFAVTFTVTAAGAATVEYEYDHEPDWGIAPPDPAAYVADLEKYPRDEDKRPDWLKQKLVEGRDGPASRDR